LSVSRNGRREKMSFERKGFYPRSSLHTEFADPVRRYRKKANFPDIEDEKLSSK
jgi:hypothetical protein